MVLGTRVGGPRWQVERSADLARNNHFVPQSYTRGWATDGNVWRYHLLVPSIDVSDWEKTPVVQFGRIRDLYTSIRSGSDSDEDERWLNEEVEDPAAEPLRKIRSDESLTRDEWRRITKYVVALRYRTLAGYYEQIEQCQKTLPPVMDRVMEGVERRLRNTQRRQNAIRQQPRPGADDHLVKVEIMPSGTPGKSLLHASIPLDREFWLHRLRVMTQLFEKLPDYSWSVLRPSHGSAWFTSDHPVFLVRYRGPGDYEFDVGGWKVKKMDIMVPISPQHLIHVAVGVRQAPTRQLTREQTVEIQLMIARNAYRSLLAQKPMLRAALMRQRTVDLELYNRELATRREWHQIQVNARGQATE